ncbi:MAG: secretin and TonB N-terminal domain-containing protein [candidate division NC10 bacterium]|nr:hypothetical protein [candidate division NC10 bacterium]MCH7895436.1 secretin and TonB N-terminal domain-containing protein [candidate division NC10 bacterium]
MWQPRSLGKWAFRLCMGGLFLLMLAGFAQGSEGAPPANDPTRVTMDLKGVEIGRVVQIIEQASGLNFVVSRDVRGPVTVRLTDVPWPQALDSILRANGYDYVRQGNIIRVDKAETLRREREIRLRRRDC